MSAHVSRKRQNSIAKQSQRNGMLIRQEESAELYSGPIPSPDILKGYEEILLLLQARELRATATNDKQRR